MELQLLFLGVVLLTVEGFIPGFGLFGITGILCLLGSLYFFLGATAQAAALVGGVLLVLAVLGFWLIRRGPKSWLGRQVTLHLRSTAARAIRAMQTGRIWWAKPVWPRRCSVLPDGP